MYCKFSIHSEPTLTSYRPKSLDKMASHMYLYETAQNPEPYETRLQAGMATRQTKSVDLAGG